MNFAWWMISLVLCVVFAIVNIFPASLTVKRQMLMQLSGNTTTAPLPQQQRDINNATLQQHSVKAGCAPRLPSTELVALAHGVIMTKKEIAEEHALPQFARSKQTNPLFVNGQAFHEMSSYIQARHPNFEEMKQQFADQGFITFRPDIPKDVLGGAQQFTQSVWDICNSHVAPIPNNTDRKCNSYHQDRYDEVQSVKELAENFHVRAMLAVLHNDEPYPFQTLNYPGTSLARTHSDWVHFASEPTHLMSAAWIALEDVHPDAGPVFYYPRTHKYPVYSMQDFGLEAREAHRLNYAKYQDVMELVANSSGFQETRAILKRGEALIWSSNLIHGGPRANRQGLTRLSQVTHYFFKGADYNWAPVMSDVNKNQIVYYDPKKIDAKWRRNGETFMATKSLPKFWSGACSDKNPSPCAKMERMPQVGARLIKHDAAEGESVM